MDPAVRWYLLWTSGFWGRPVINEFSSFFQSLLCSGLVWCLQTVEVACSLVSFPKTIFSTVVVCDNIHHSRFPPHGGREILWCWLFCGNCWLTYTWQHRLVKGSSWDVAGDKTGWWWLLKWARSFSDSLSWGHCRLSLHSKIVTHDYDWMIMNLIVFWLEWAQWLRYG